MSSDEEDESEYTPVKVVLLGDSGVGKTSIITRYVNNTFSQVLMSTTGASFATKLTFLKEDNIKVKFEIWDTAGQERYRSLAKIFYKNAGIIILVYDITLKKSFDSLKEFWIKEIRENANSDVILVVAGNKSDDYEKEEVKNEEAKAFAKEIGAIFKVVSARMDIGIKEVFQLSAQKYFNPTLDAGNTTMTKEEEQEYKRRIQREKFKMQEEKSKETKNNKKKCC